MKYGKISEWLQKQCKASACANVMSGAPSRYSFFPTLCNIGASYVSSNPFYLLIVSSNCVTLLSIRLHPHLLYRCN